MINECKNCCTDKKELNDDGYCSLCANLNLEQKAAWRTVMLPFKIGRINDELFEKKLAIVKHLKETSGDDAARELGRLI